MSNIQNDNLFERAEEQLEYWTNTMWARVIEADIDRNDLEALSYHVNEAEREMAIQEDNHEFGEMAIQPDDVY